MTHKPVRPGKAGLWSAFFYEPFMALREDPLVKALYGVSVREGTVLYLVGGLLRDMALYRSWSRDYDVVTEDGPGRIAMGLAQGFRAKAFPMDEKRDVWRVVKKRGATEFTVDIAPLDGATIEEDLLRRDFTVNALAVELKSLYETQTPAIIDPAGGMRDIKERRLRVVSKDGFSRDPLRLLRALRLCQLHNLRLERNTERLLKENTCLITQTAVERIREELIRVFSHRGSARTMKRLFSTGLADHILPELSGWRHSTRYPILTHSLKTLEETEKLLDEDPLLKEFPALKEHLERETSPGVKRKTILKLGSFLHDCGKPETLRVKQGELKFWGHDVEGEKIAKNILKRLRFGRKTSNIVSAIVRNHHRVFTLFQLERPTDRARSHFFNAVGGDVGLELLCLGIADARATRGGEDPVLYGFVREMVGFYFRVYARKRPRPVMDGHDIMNTFGIGQGPLVGEIKRKIEEGVERGVVSDRKSAIDYVRRWLEERGRPSS